MAEKSLTQCVHAVFGAARIQHIRQQHRVVERLHVDAVAGQDQPVVFHVLRDFQNGGGLQQRLERFNGHFNRYLAFRRTAAEQIVRARYMAQGNIAGFAGDCGQRDAHQIGLHGIKRGSFRINGDVTQFARLIDPSFQRVSVPHGLVGCVVNGHCGHVPGDRFRQMHGLKCGAITGRRFFGLWLIFIANVEIGTTLIVAVDRDCVCVDGRDVSICFGGDTAGQGVEFQRLQIGNQFGTVDRLQRQIINRNIKGGVIIEGHKSLGNPRLIGKFDQIFAALVLLDLTRTFQKRFQITEFGEQLGGGFGTDAWNTGHVVGGIACQRLQVDHHVRLNAEFLNNIVALHHAIFHGVIHDHMIVD